MMKTGSEATFAKSPGAGGSGPCSSVGRGPWSKCNCISACKRGNVRPARNRATKSPDRTTARAACAMLGPASIGGCVAGAFAKRRRSPESLARRLHGPTRTPSSSTRPSLSVGGARAGNGSRPAWAGWPLSDRSRRGVSRRFHRKTIWFPPALQGSVPPGAPGPGLALDETSATESSIAASDLTTVPQGAGSATADRSCARSKPKTSTNPSSRRSSLLLLLLCLSTRLLSVLASPAAAM